MKLITRREYDAKCEATKNERLRWFREARYGLFIHYGLFSAPGRGEWLQTQENIPIEEYEKLTASFTPKEGCCDEWCALAKRSGMKYAVLTTRHHEGFSLWDSKVNPYNSFNVCGRDLVREFTDACRKYGLRIGLYSSLMDWHHPDGGRCAYDLDARRRFTEYLCELNGELLSNYGKIDILWYDMPWPMESSESWDSANRNNYLRSLQPDLLINNRSKMPEDFGTPEGAINEEDRWWEACMTFNGISWGYIDSEQAKPYSHSAQDIIRMLRKCSAGGGNLLLNIGPTPDGSVPEEAVAPLEAVGAWLSENGEAVYGEKTKLLSGMAMGNGVTDVTVSADQRKYYFWNYIWPKNGELVLGGYMDAPKKVYLLSDGRPLDFEMRGHAIAVKGLPDRSPDRHAGIPVVVAEFDKKPEFVFASYYPQIHGGKTYV